MKKCLLAIGMVLAGFAAKAQYFSEDFTTPQTWSVLDVDGDGNNWGIGTVTAFSGQGNVAVSNSWDSVALTPDNYLISPVIDLTGVTGTVALSFKIGSPETTASAWYEEYLSVYAFDGVNGLAAALATPIHDQVLAGGEQMYYFAYDISSFAGADSLMIAFRHHNCTDENFIVLDEINVTNTLGINLNVIETAVFPNPATDVLNIKSEEEIAVARILTLDGKVVKTVSNGTIDVSELTSGMYFYNVETISGKLATGNFVKK